MPIEARNLHSYCFYTRRYRPTLPNRMYAAKTLELALRRHIFRGPYTSV